jgi:hypothetical protein
MENSKDNQGNDRPSTSELLGTAPEQIKRQNGDNDEVIYTTEPEDSNFFQVYIGIASIVLVILGLIALSIWFFTIEDTQPTEPTAVTPEHFFNVKMSEKIQLSTSTDITARIKSIEETELLSNSFLQIYFTQQTASGERLIGGGELMQQLVEDQQSVGTYLSDAFMYGLYVDEKGEKYPYIIFEVMDYNNAYGSMLQTEDVFVKALETLTFPGVSNFSDDIIQNQDVRVATNDAGGYFYYSFPRQNKLVVTTSRTTLREIFNRL